MSDFKAKSNRNRFRLGSAPDPAGGAYSAPPDLLAGIRGHTSKGRGELEGKEGGEMETKALKRREEWEKVEGRGRKGKASGGDSRVYL